ncbi:SIMPL domain-containing protein [Parahaliea mediterranea]|uniref:SIMPL domain-containing protein n=1 Tax=Parahaliea mediterranea TaxID=651086 RepID=A0A939DFA9_9GAMM|nr:SIMPL domain-containing protein [Parahaliea mediterranea]MBN7796826.1 SIMPL domain-containing protein [Parahaliea mediterranea]
MTGTFLSSRLAIAALALLLLAPLARAADQPAPSINVSGEGSVSLAPDTALLSLTVTREAKTAREALAANSAAMEKVVAAMRDAGIADRDLQTGEFNIQPRYVHQPARAGEPREAPRIEGYTVRNNLNVRVRDIDRAGEILDTSVKMGVNEGGDISLVNDDPSEALDKARELAMKDALARAGTLAAAAGVRTGKLLRVDEQNHFPSPRPMMARGAAFLESAEKAVPIAHGENTYRVVVSIAVAIEQ